MKTKKFTTLHFNDMHGDFLAEIQGTEGKLIGGLALPSGYINKVRQEEENVIYVISGCPGGIPPQLSKTRKEG